MKIIFTTTIILLSIVSYGLYKQYIYLSDYDRGTKALNEGDVDTAFAKFHASAEQGDILGQSLLGFMYGRGFGVPKDGVRSLMWLSIASARGHQPSRVMSFIAVKGMTEEQMGKVQELATACLKKNYKGC